MLRRFLRFCIRVTIGVVVGIAGLIGLGLVVGNYLASNQAPASAVPVPQGGLELIDTPKAVTNEYGYMEITGRVKNTSSKTYSYAQITFIVANNAGEQVGSAMANVNNVEAGATWKFRAVSLATGGTKFKLGKISGW